MSKPRVILDSRQLNLTIDRLCQQLIEVHEDFSDIAIIGVQPRGALFSDRLVERLSKFTGRQTFDYGKLDITFYRDDFRRRSLDVTPNSMQIGFSVEGKRVILVDDVLFTGRTIRAALDALIDFGRPANVELMVLIDRRMSRHLPIQPDFIGKTVDAIHSERVKVDWKDLGGKDQVLLLTESDKA